MTTKRKVYTADFKAKVARDAIRGIKTLEELGSEYGVHPVMVSKWKALLEKNAASIFDKNKDHEKEIEKKEEKIERLYATVGQREYELDWLKKKMGIDTG